MAQQDVTPFSRSCPTCGELIYHWDSYTCRKAAEKGSKCRSCRHKDPVWREKCRQAVLRGYADPNSRYNDPENSVRRSAARRKVHQDPESKFNSGEWRKKVSKGMHRFYGTDPDNPASEIPGLSGWCDRVKKRDGYICKSCGHTARLVAHHIKLKALHPSLAIVDENGITLCEDCHYQVHYVEVPSSDFLRDLKARLK